MSPEAFIRFVCWCLVALLLFALLWHFWPVELRG